MPKTRDVTAPTPAKTTPYYDIDAQDKLKLDCVTEYVRDMYAHFGQQEQSAIPYMNQQPEIKASRRANVVDMLVAVHQACRLSPETLHLAVPILDRFLANEPIKKTEIWLVGFTSLLIASKYEDIYFEAIVDFVKGHAEQLPFTFNHVLDMETKILKSLDYRISFPTAYTFLKRFARAAGGEKRICQTASYLLDTVLLSYGLLKFKPSQLAAGCMFLARHHRVGRTSWSATMETYTGYNENEVAHVARAILQAKSESHKGIVSVDKKYTTNFGGVAVIRFRNDF